MSYFSDLLKGRITFGTFVTESEQYVVKLVDGNALTTAVAGVVLSDAKQAASDAITAGQGALGPFLTDGALALEAALEAFLAKATGGLSVVANPLINAGIDTAAGVFKAAIDAWAVKTKASLASTPTVVIPPATAVQNTFLPQ